MAAESGSGSGSESEEGLSGSSGEEEEELESGGSDSDSEEEGGGGGGGGGGAAGQGSSKGAAKRKRAEAGGDGEDSGGECEIVDGCSGDEMDPTLIIPGGRASRRGRATSGNPYAAAPPAAPARKPTNPYAGADSDDDDF